MRVSCVSMTSKSPLKVAKAAYEAGKKARPDYAHKYNRQDFTYGQRWQVESVVHMLKSRQGESLTARTYRARRREMDLMALVYNLMIVRRIRGFLQSNSDIF